MEIDNVGANPYALYQSRGVIGGGPDQAVEDSSASSDQNRNENSTSYNLRAATIAAPRVSDAVHRTLINLQESGRIFDLKDQQLMNIRGISNEDRQRFAQIVQNAASTGAYNSPVAYIKSLPPEDVEVLRRVHSLAERQGVTDVTTEEGAINLLLPPGNQVDINNDSIVTTGIANGFRFPPPNAPQSVKDAWEQTTLNMSPGDKLMAEAPFLMSMFSANVKTDSNGTIVGFYEPGDPEFKSAFGTTEDEWHQFMTKMISEYEQAVKRFPDLQGRLDMLKEFAGHMNTTTHSTTTAKTDQQEKVTDEATAETNHKTKETFLDFVNKTPEERMYSLLLAEEGLTEEELAALPPDERAAIERKIQEKIRERLGKKVEITAND